MAALLFFSCMHVYMQTRSRRLYTSMCECDFLRVQAWSYSCPCTEVVILTICKQICLYDRRPKVCICMYVGIFLYIYSVYCIHAHVHAFACICTCLYVSECLDWIVCRHAAHIRQVFSLWSSSTCLKMYVCQSCMNVHDKVCVSTFKLFCEFNGHRICDFGITRVSTMPSSNFTHVVNIVDVLSAGWGMACVLRAWRGSRQNATLHVCVYILCIHSHMEAYILMLPESCIWQGKVYICACIIVQLEFMKPVRRRTHWSKSLFKLIIISPSRRMHGWLACLLPICTQVRGHPDCDVPSIVPCIPRPHLARRFYLCFSIFVWIR